MPEAAPSDAAPSTTVPSGITDAYKSAFRGHPAGVAVITAEGPDGPTGLTASSVASVAIDPPVHARHDPPDRAASQPFRPTLDLPSGRPRTQECRPLG